MPDVICFAVDSLYQDVVDLFTLEGVEVPNVFGWREPAKRKQGASRIVWTPGDDTSTGTMVSSIVGPTRTGMNPRQLAVVDELLTVRLESFDATDPENELMQYRAARILFDIWFRAVLLSSTTNTKIVSATWDKSKTERRHGQMITVIATVRAPILDAEIEYAPADVSEDVAVELIPDLGA